MHLDVIDLKKFYYKTKLGRITKHFLQETVSIFWNDLMVEQLAGFGFAAPIMSSLTNTAKNSFCECASI